MIPYTYLEQRMRISFLYHHTTHTATCNSCRILYQVRRVVRSLYLLHLSRAYCLPLPRPAPSLFRCSRTAPPITAWNFQWRSESHSPSTDTLVVYIFMLPAFKAPLTPLALTFSTLTAIHLPSLLINGTRCNRKNEGCLLSPLGLVGGLRSCILVPRRPDNFQPW